MEDIKEWLINWFIKNTDVFEEDIRKNTDANYFANGWIDSLAFINFISDIEDKFGISFSNDEFQNRGFATISGLAKIIEDRKNV